MAGPPYSACSSAALLACGDDPREPSSDDVAIIEDPGTATAGGNPAISIGFSYFDRDDVPTIVWEAPLFHIGDIRPIRDRDGVCDDTDVQWQTLDETVALTASRWLSLAADGLCRIEMRPIAGMPLVEVFGQIGDVNIGLDYPLEDGLAIEITQGERLTELGRGFLDVDVDDLLEGIDVDALFDGDTLVVVDPDILAEAYTQLRNNFGAATRFYLDTTPEDLLLDPAARIEANEFAGLRVP